MLALTRSGNLQTETERMIQKIERPALDRHLDSKTFRDFYYLKEELADFCKKNGLPATGGKTEITNRIAYFLDTGKVLSAPAKREKTVAIASISEDTKIEPDLVCTEQHRAFFKEQIGKSFSFHVDFQKWLKNNAGKTYQEAIRAYHQIIENKQRGKSTIDKQFEYNAYIRDFFSANKGKSLAEAIQCWKYKKQFKGHHRYEESDLMALE